MQLWINTVFVNVPIFAMSSSRIQKPLKRIAVIGGGAAGYFSSIEAAQLLKSKLGPNQYEVVIFEAGKYPLSKVLISGGGRCNVMHDPRKGSRTISKGYPRGYRELLGPLSSKFGPDETYYWFTSKGIHHYHYFNFVILV
jgi:predicted flavoprotein YhiN